MASSPLILPADKPVEEQTLPELLAASGYTIGEVSEGDDDPPEPGPTEGTIAPTANGEAEETDVPPPESAEGSEHRDPTMPQFRPNSLADMRPAPQAASVAAAASAGSVSPTVFASASEPSPSNGGRGEAKAGNPRRRREKDGADTPTPIPRATLVEWKRLDVAEQEAKERGGWGKLDYAEFEAICKMEEDHSARLDYLGTWIDFCIP